MPRATPGTVVFRNLVTSILPLQEQVCPSALRYPLLEDEGEFGARYIKVRVGIVKDGGLVRMVGRAQKEATPKPAQNHAERDNITIKGRRMFDRADMPRVVGLVEEGRLRLGRRDEKNIVLAR
jgi:hypothetical protein